jgi:radical SAM protein with 4Fe4S-binding SPASM domain
MVYPCQFVDFYPLGNVLETGLADILRIDGNKLDYFIETHKYLKGPKCSNCPFKFICQGGDRVRAYYLGGSLYADDPQCHLDIIKIASRWGI